MNDQTPRTHAGLWNMTAGGLIVLAAALLWGVNITGNAWLLVAVPAGAVAVASTGNAGRDLTRLLDAVARRARTAALLEASSRIPHQARVWSLTGACPNLGWGPPTRARDTPAPAAAWPVGK